MIGQATHYVLSDVKQKTWDALVVGAGPAGSLAADLLARRGASVLLVDAKTFPRVKVCGGCLNAHSLEILHSCGLESVLADSSATSLESIRLVSQFRSVEWSLTNNIVVNRAQFDHALVSAAQQSGAQFFPGVSAQVLNECDRESRHVQLKQGTETVQVAARIVLCADGLGQSSLRLLPEFSVRIDPSSRIGLGAVLSGEDRNYPLGQLTMAIAPTGYVGLTRSADGSLTIASAIDSLRRQESSTSSEVIRSILESCSLPVPSAVDTVRWYGAPGLTRRSSRVSAERLLVLGDSAGYVEPFTGEGMTWAMQTSVLAVPIALRAINDECDSLIPEWNRILTQQVFRKQWMCRLLTRILRSSTLTNYSLALCQRLPRLRRTVMSRIVGQSGAPLVTMPLP